MAGKQPFPFGAILCGGMKWRHLFLGEVLPPNNSEEEVRLHARGGSLPNLVPSHSASSYATALSGVSPKGRVVCTQQGYSLEKLALCPPLAIPLPHPQYLQRGMAMGRLPAKLSTLSPSRYATGPSGIWGRALSRYGELPDNLSALTPNSYAIAPSGVSPKWGLLAHPREAPCKTYYFCSLCPIWSVSKEGGEVPACSGEAPCQTECPATSLPHPECLQGGATCTLWGGSLAN